MSRNAIVFVVLSALGIALAAFAIVTMRPARVVPVVTVEPPREIVTRILAQPEEPGREAVAFPEPERLIARSFVDANVREIERLRAELDECRYPRDTPIGIAHALPEWPHLNDEERRDVEWFLRVYPVKLAWGEAQMIATYRAADGGDRLADVIRTLGRERVRASLKPEARLEFDETYP